MTRVMLMYPCSGTNSLSNSEFLTAFELIWHCLCLGDLSSTVRLGGLVPSAERLKASMSGEDKVAACIGCGPSLRQS